MLHLRELREKRGLSQNAVAQAIGVSRQAYNFYENNKRDPDTSTVKALADLYGVSADYLLGRDDSDVENSPIEPDVQEITKLFERLPEDKKALVLAMARAMVND